MAAKKESNTYNLSFAIVGRVVQQVDAPSIEDALEAAKTFKFADLVSEDTEDYYDDEVELTGVYEV